MERLQRQEQVIRDRQRILRCKRVVFKPHDTDITGANICGLRRQHSVCTVARRLPRTPACLRIRSTTRDTSSNCVRFGWPAGENKREQRRTVAEMYSKWFVQCFNYIQRSTICHFNPNMYRYLYQSEDHFSRFCYSNQTIALGREKWSQNRRVRNWTKCEGIKRIYSDGLYFPI